MIPEIYNLLHGRTKVKEEDISLQEALDKLDNLDESVKVDGNVKRVMYRGKNNPRGISPEEAKGWVEKYLTPERDDYAVYGKHRVYRGLGKDRHYLELTKRPQGSKWEMLIRNFTHGDFEYTLPTED